MKNINYIYSVILTTAERFILKISWTGAPEHMDRRVGYGEASYYIFKELEKQGVECLLRAKSPNIGISFVQPDAYSFGKHQYKIGYSPWESTDIFPSWKAPLNNLIDEMWTTSPWCAEIFSKHTDKPVFVYEHGVDDSWIPRKRSLDKSRPFRFLHVGEPASRKDAQMVVDAFISLYGNNPEYELILKCSAINTTRVFDKTTGQVIGSPDSMYKNIRIIEAFISPEQMRGLYDLCDVFVYPSWGEGFGFNPLQSMAQGMPTICTSSWATYARYITMPINATWWESPWPATHPGLLTKPDYAQLKNYMKDVAEDYEYYSGLAYKNSFLIHKDYNWEKVTKPAAERLKKIESEISRKYL